MKRCAVCGDTCSTNVRLAWRRDSDGRTVNVCMLCAETGKVNAQSIDNFTDSTTEYRAKEDSRKEPATMSAFYREKYKLGGTVRVRGKLK